MAVAWPAGLPKAPSAFSVQGAPTAIHTQPDSGPSKTRRRFTKAKQQAKMDFLLTIPQWAILKTFFEDTLEGGTLQMIFLHPWTQTNVNMTIKEPPAFANEDSLGVRASFPVEYF